MRRSLIKNAAVVVDRPTDILVKVLATDSTLRYMMLTGTDVTITEELTGNVLWSCQGEGTLSYWDVLNVSSPNIDVRLTAKKMKSINFGYNVSDVKKFRVNQNCDLTRCFYQNNNLKTVSDFNVDNVLNLNTLFYGCYNLESIEPFYVREKSKLITAFYGCTKITTCPILNLEVAGEIPNIFSSTGLNNLTNIQGKDFKATVVGGMFNNTPLTNISNITFSEALFIEFSQQFALTEVSNITCPKATRVWFTYNSNLVSIDNITANVCTNFNFNNCSKLTTFTNITHSPGGLLEGENMFVNCSSLTTVPNFNYYNITNCNNMFAGCTNLTDTSNLNVFAVRYANQMFGGCTSLVSLPSINYTAITQCEWLFGGCTNLLGAVSLTLGAVGSASNMFKDCPKITSINLYFQGSTFLVLNGGFYNCSDLEVVDIVIIGSAEYQMSLNSAFQNCIKLVYASLPPIATSCDYQDAFNNCTALATIPTGMGSVGDFRRTFYLCTSLKEVRNRTFKSVVFSSYQQQMAGLNDVFSLSGIVTVENVTFIGGVTGGYEPNYFSIWTLFDSCVDLENVTNITLDTGGNMNVIFTINNIFRNCPKLVGRIPVTINNTANVDHLRSYNFLSYPGIISYNNEVDLSWSKSIIEFYDNPTIKTINFNIGTMDVNTFYGQMGIAGFSYCPELESLTITNPNMYPLEGVNVYNGNWGTWIPFLENCPKLTYLKIEGLSRSTIIPQTITDISMIEQILDDIVDMTNHNKQYLTIGETRKALVDPLKITAAQNKNWEIQ